MPVFLQPEDVNEVNELIRNGGNAKQTTAREKKDNESVKPIF